MGITRLSHKPGAPETRNAGKALLKAFSGIMALQAAWFWTSNLQNYVRVHFCYLNTKFVVISHNNPGKLRKKESEVAQLCPTLWDPMDCSLPGPPPMGFSRREYWSGWPFPPPGDLPNPAIKPGSPALQADALPSEPPGKLRQKPRQTLRVSYQAFAPASLVLLELTPMPFSTGLS